MRNDHILYLGRLQVVLPSTDSGNIILKRVAKYRNAIGEGGANINYRFPNMRMRIVIFGLERTCIDPKLFSQPCKIDQSISQPASHARSILNQISQPASHARSILNQISHARSIDRSASQTAMQDRSGS
jgi:hypothetical protein